jgi:hypothetical protein
MGTLLPALGYRALPIRQQSFGIVSTESLRHAARRQRAQGALHSGVG